MKKITSNSPAQEAPVELVLERISAALGQGWMALLEVQPETVRTWRKRGEVPIRKLLRAAQLSGRTVESFNTPAGEPAVVQETCDEFTPIDVLDARVSAGHGSNNGHHEVIGKFAFRTSWLRSKGLNPGVAKIVRARGNSMADRINDGDILLVNTSVNVLGQDGIYLIEIDGEDYVKFLQRDFGTGGVRIVSYNPDYPVQVLEGEAANRLRITGRVIWHGGEL